jgi:hypothetical protein
MLVRWSGTDEAMIELAKRNVLALSTQFDRSVIVETEQRRRIMGVIDGGKSKGIEDESDIAWRKECSRQLCIIIACFRRGEIPDRLPFCVIDCVNLRHASCQRTPSSRHPQKFQLLRKISRWHRLCLKTSYGL